MSLYSDSEGKYSLISEVLLPYVGLINFHAKFCGWEILDVPVATTGSIRKFLAHYGEINLSYIKVQAEIINAANNIIEKEYYQI